MGKRNSTGEQRRSFRKALVTAMLGDDDKREWLESNYGYNRKARRRFMRERLTLKVGRNGPRVRESTASLARAKVSAPKRAS